jgi:hypothetical protein
MRTPNPKCPYNLACILEEIRQGMIGPPKISQKVLHQKMLAELRWDAPGFSTMIQNLNYWTAAFRKPSPLRLGTMYFIACGKRLTERQIRNALDTPEEGIAPAKLRVTTD